MPTSASKFSWGILLGKNLRIEIEIAIHRVQTMRNDFAPDNPRFFCPSEKALFFVDVCAGHFRSFTSSLQ